jgi:hypothetical protein
MQRNMERSMGETKQINDDMIDKMKVLKFLFYSSYLVYFKKHGGCCQEPKHGL